MTPQHPVAPPEKPGEQKSLDIYLAQVRRHRLLSREEEESLTKNYAATRDPAIGRRIIEANLRLVVKTAFQLAGFAPHRVMDFIQEGNMGLMRAVERFDPARRVRFATYAMWWIRAHIVRAIVDGRCLVRIGTRDAERRLFFRLGREQDRLSAKGAEADAAALAEAFGISVEDVMEIQARLGYNSERSLDDVVFGGEFTWADVLESRSPGPDVAAQESDFQRRLAECMRAFETTLPPREREVFRERMLSDDPKTLAVVGERLGLSRERIRQLEAEVSRRLRVYLEREMGTAALEEALGKPVRTKRERRTVAA